MLARKEARGEGLKFYELIKISGKVGDLLVYMNYPVDTLYLGYVNY